MFALCLLLTLMLGGSLAAPTSGGGVEGQAEELVPIIKSLAEQKNDGSYFFAYEGADGSYREEVGIVKRLNNNNNNNKINTPPTDDDDDNDETELEISGVYRYIDSNGQRVEVSYVADKNGFVPVGTNIPKEISDTARNAVQSLEVRAATKS